jgi:hypothetical protein
MTPSLVYNYLLAQGAHIVGTTKRALCWPFTFAQKVDPDKDKRTDVGTKGPQALLVKSLQHSGKTLSAVAFRNGTDTVSTALSSLHRTHHWDGVSRYPSERECYKIDPNSLRSHALENAAHSFVPSEEEAQLENDRNFILSFLESKGTTSFRYEASSSNAPLLTDVSVKILTLRQGTADWFIARRFSLTSSQSYTAFHHAAEIFRDEPHWIKVAKYLSFNFPPRQPPPPESGETPLSLYRTFFKELLQSHPLCPVKKRCLEKIDYLLDNDSTLSNEQKLAIYDELTDIPKDFVSIIYSRLDESKRSKEPKGNVQSLDTMKSWIIASNYKRMYIGYTKKSLDTIAKERRCKLVKASMNIGAIIEALAKDDSDNASGGGANTSENKCKIDTIKAILKWSFMKTLTGSAKEYTSLGHKLETPILLAFMNEINSNDETINGNDLFVRSAFKIGLVEKIDSPYAKDSIDFLAVVSDQGVNKCWGVEIKSRLSNNTASMEETISLDRDQKYIRCRSSSNDMRKALHNSDERLQLLHHAYVYKVPSILYLAGNENGQVIQGVLVDFEDHLLSCYGQVLEDIKNLALGWIYNADDESSVEESSSDDEDDEIEVKVPAEVLSIYKDIFGDEYSLLSAYYLWRRIFMNPSQILPIPSLERVIPAIHSYWNGVKSGSDTTTKLMDKCSLIPPTNNLESKACARLIMLAFVTFHRILQICTSKKHLESITSLEKFRHAANQRMTFQDTLLQCYSLFSSDHDTMPDNRLDDDDGRSGGLKLRKKVKGVLPVVISYAAEKTNKTPQRNISSRIQKQTVDDEVMDRWNNCQGKPFLRLIDENGTPVKATCSCCPRITSWKCIECNAFFCMQVSSQSHLYLCTCYFIFNFHRRLYTLIASKKE